MTQAIQTLTESQTSAPDLISKLKSRKLWMALLGAVGGILGMINAGDNLVAIGIYVLLMIVSIVGYFFTEGTIDNTRNKELIALAVEIANILAELDVPLVPLNMDEGILINEDDDCPDEYTNSGTIEETDNNSFYV